MNKDCPCCEYGKLIRQVGRNEELNVPLHYSVCDICKSEVADNSQILKNLDEVIDPICRWLNACAALEVAYDKADRLLDYAKERAVMPKNTRPATARDIVEGNIIWYDRDKYDSDEPYWKCVQEVYRPDDDWKAYCAEDGNRYGLDGALVEVTDV